MQARVAEFPLGRGPFSRKRKVRVDLHGVSLFGPGRERTLLRWEWITQMLLDEGLVIRSQNAQIKLPPGSFGLPPEKLLALLEQARSIELRGEIIGRLSGAA